MTFNDIRLYGMIGFNNAVDGVYSSQLFIIGAIIMAAVAYMMGSLNFAIIISKVKYRDDIRKYGSGNAGMTNMMRTYGTAAAVFTFLGDILKAVVSVLLAEFLFGETIAYIAGVACVLGHAFPCWYKFKGGKGVAVSAAMILTLEPLVFLFVLLIFLIVVLITRYISLGSIMAALMYPLLLSEFYPAIHAAGGAILYPVIFISSIIVMVLVLFLHRENMKRLLDGKENKFSFKKKGTQNDENINKE